MIGKIIKVGIQLSGGILIGACLTAMYSQLKVMKAHRIRNQQKRYGSDFQLTEENKKILEEADEYLKGHVGRKFASMLRTQEFYQYRVQKKLKEKQEILSTLTETQKQKIQQLKSQIQQLNRVYAAVKYKKIANYEQLREKQQQEQDY